jgi:hypothetical protein
MASKAHLMAAPVPGTPALILIGRDHDPAFEESDLALLGALAEEATSVLQASLEVRALARELHSLEDLPD